MKTLDPGSGHKAAMPPLDPAPKCDAALCDIPVHSEDGWDVVISEEQQGGQPAFYQTLVSMKPWVKKNTHMQEIQSLVSVSDRIEQNRRTFFSPTSEKFQRRETLIRKVNETER